MSELKNAFTWNDKSSMFIDDVTTKAFKGKSRSQIASDQVRNAVKAGKKLDTIPGLKSIYTKPRKSYP